MLAHRIEQNLEFNTENLIQKLGKSPMFSALSYDELRLFAEHGEFVELRKNRMLIRQGDHSNGLFIVLSGKVRVYLSGGDTFAGQSKEILLSIETEGSYIGEISLLDNQPRTASVKTVEDSCFLMISRETFQSIVERNPALSLSLIRGMTERFRSTIDSVKQFAFNSVYGRLVSVLVQFSTEDGDHRSIMGRLTHQNIADMIGSSRVMVSKIMKDLVIGGYITVEKDRMIINRKLPDQY
ncbi:MAG: catabolite gene activator [marine bacterium B5-7]|nr:MAG: catabolite gene activator [marine bacterium B5-7]